MGDARAAAIAWLEDYARQDDGFRGALLVGSTVGLSDAAELPTGSDLDVMVVRAGVPRATKLGKFLHGGALLEVSYLKWEQIASASDVLSDYHLAGVFRTNTVVADPTGQLTKIGDEVSREFARRPWVLSRCRDAYHRITDRLGALDAAAPLAEQVTTCLFAAGVTTHVLLVAGLRNPTIRLRYLACRDLLADFDRSRLYPQLLRLVGCESWTPDDSRRHVDALARTFDATAAVARTPFFFSSDITAAARPIAIDASRELIHRGLHREAVFWIVATFARCHTILGADAPGLQRRLLPDFLAVLHDLGLATPAALAGRADQVQELLPEVWRHAEAIVDAHPDITD